MLISACLAFVILGVLMYASFVWCRPHTLVATLSLLRLTWALEPDFHGLGCRGEGSVSGLVFMVADPTRPLFRVNLLGPNVITWGNVFWMDVNVDKHNYEREKIFFTLQTRGRQVKDVPYSEFSH